MKAWAVLMLSAFLLSGCGDEKSAEPASVPSSKQTAVQPRPVKITTATSELRDIDVIEEALGRILDPATTTLAGEWY